MGQRQYKVNEQIKHEVSAYMQEKLSSHKGILTITAVETSPDMRQALVWFGYVGSDVGSATTEIKRHSREIQKHLNQHLSMKYVPRLKFQIDNSGDYAQKISKIIDKSL